MKHIGTCSFTIAHELSTAEGQLAIVAEEVLVLFDYNAKEKYCFPAACRQRIEELEGETFSL